MYSPHWTQFVKVDIFIGANPMLHHVASSAGLAKDPHEKWYILFLDTIMASEPFVKLRVTINGFFIEHFETSTPRLLKGKMTFSQLTPPDIPGKKLEGQESSRFCCPSAVSYFELRSSEVKNEDQRIAILFIIFIQYFLKNINSAHFPLSMQWN